MWVVHCGEEGERSCNCRGGKENCQAGGTCLAKGVVYQAEVAAQGEVTKFNIGSAATTLKERISKDFTWRK